MGSVGVYSLEEIQMDRGCLSETSDSSVIIGYVPQLIVKTSSVSIERKVERPFATINTYMVVVGYAIYRLSERKLCAVPKETVADMERRDG